MKIRAIIIDDEFHSLKTTELLIKEYCKSVDILDLAETPEKGIELIENLHPQLVFLDIAMPVMNGFELLQHVSFTQFEIIFTTAYDEYAIRAFKVNAIDYLLKPIEKDELIAAIKKVKNKLMSTEEIGKIREILSGYKNAGFKRDKVALPVDGKICMIPFIDIIYCASDSNYTHIYLTDGSDILLSKTLKEVEKMIDNHDFFRVQNSYLVNLNHIKEYIRGEGGELIMSNGDEVRVSRNKKEALLRLLS